MVVGKTMGKLFTICEWVMRFAYVNVLWMLFSIAGLLIFGIMPASIALFTIVRKWQMNDTEIPVWKTFVTVYRQELKKSNGIGVLLYIGGVLTILDLLFVKTVDGVLQFVLIVPLIIILAFYIITILYIFPVYVQYELKILDYLKNALLIGILNFHMTILMLVSLAAIIFCLLYLPSLIPFFGAVSISWVLMFGGNYGFERIEELQSKTAKTES
jgi:uncharacterized membrane protein YesL